MIKIDCNINDLCYPCKHYGFCQIYWGAECKRQGGTRTPRLKSALLKQEKVSRHPTVVYKNQDKRTISRNYEPIRTRRVNWAL